MSHYAWVLEVRPAEAQVVVSRTKSAARKISDGSQSFFDMVSRLLPINSGPGRAPLAGVAPTSHAHFR